MTPSDTNGSGDRLANGERARAGGEPANEERARGERRGPATLQSIADELGVHVSTVSRVLNGRDDGRRAASGATAERIRRLAAERGYRANPHATSLRTSRSQLIGVLVPRLTDVVLATIYEGIEEAAAERGFATFVASTHDRPEAQREQTSMMRARRVDGLIFGDAHVDGRFLAEVAAEGTTFALVSRRAGDYPAVTCDDRLGGRLAAEHLLGLGHREVAVIAGQPYASTGIDRTAGFVERFREAGVEVPAERIVHAPFDAAGGRAAAEQLLAAGDVTAIFAVNDFDALGAAGAARDRGLTLGQELSLVGFNDVSIAGELPIPLTTVRSPMHAMGRRAAEQLLARLAGEEVASERLAPTLVARASTGPAVNLR